LTGQAVRYANSPHSPLPALLLIPLSEQLLLFPQNANATTKSIDNFSVFVDSLFDFHATPT
jgi:hypothetical protein